MAKRKQSDRGSPAPESNDAPPGTSTRERDPGRASRPRRSPAPESNDAPPGPSTRERLSHRANRPPRRPAPDSNDAAPGTSTRERDPDRASRPRRSPAPESNDAPPGPSTRERLSHRANRPPRRPAPDSNDAAPGTSTRERDAGRASRPPRRPAAESNDGPPGTSTRQRSPGRASRRPRTPAPESDAEQPGPSREDLAECLLFVRKVNAYFKDVDPGKYTAFMDLMIARKREIFSCPCVISQVKVLFRDHKEMIKLFNDMILPPGLKILLKEDVQENQDLSGLYVAKVKMRSSTSVYTTFMHILYLHDARALPSDEVDREVEVLLAESCDLLEEYHCLQPDQAAPVVQSPLHPGHSSLEVSELQRKKQRKRLRRMCENIAKRKLKEKGKGVVTECKQQSRSPPAKTMSARLAEAENALVGLISSLSSVEAHARSVGVTPAAKTRRRSRASEDAKYNGRAICTTSYMLLKPSTNGDGEVSVHRSELAKSVLNEEFKLVPERGSEKQLTVNPYEEVLFACETHQYECDMMIKKLEAAGKSFMNYLLKLEKPNNGELPPVAELLLVVNKECIYEFYGSDAQAVIEALKENSAKELPVLINQVILKLEELKIYKTKTTPMWMQVYKDNLHLSLNYSSI